MLDGHAIFRLNAHRRLSEGFCGIAAAVQMRLLAVADRRLPALCFKIGDVCLLLVLDAYERCRKARDLGLLGHDKRHRLAVESHVLVVERAERCAGRSDLIAVFLFRSGKLRPVHVREHVEHAVDRQRIGGMDAPDPSLGDGRRDDEAVRQTGDVVLGRVSRRARHLRPALDPRGRLAEKARCNGGCAHGTLPLTRLSACDCGFPSAGLRQGAHDRAARQFDLEVVVPEAARAAQHRVGAARKALARGRRAVELSLGFAIAPRLVGDAAEREARLPDSAAFDFEPDRDRNERERIGQAVADLEIGIVPGKALGRQLDRGDDLVGTQIAVDLRRVAGQAVEVGEGDAALARRAGRQHARIKRGQRNAHVGRMRGDAMFAGAEDRVHAVDTADRRAAAARLALVAWRARVVEIEAARSLQQVAAGRGHVAQLLRSAGEDGAGEQRIAGLDLRVPGEIAVRHQGADAQTAIFGLLDPVEREMGDVDQPRWPRDMLLDEVDDVGAAGNEFRLRVSRDLAHGIGNVRRARIAEIVHGAPSPEGCLSLPITSSIAATMWG